MIAKTTATVTATTTQTDPLGKCNTSTRPTATPAAITTPPARTRPVCERRRLTRCSERVSRAASSEAYGLGSRSEQAGGVSDDRVHVGASERVHAHDADARGGRPRAPREVRGDEEHERGGADGRREMADAGIVADP